MTQPPPTPLQARLAALGAVPPTSLTEARLTLHWAAQPVSAFGFTVLPPRDDHSHTTLRWDHERQSLRSGVHEDTGLHAALHPEALALSLRRGDEELERLALPGRRLDEAYAWLGEALRRAGHAAADGVTRPEHESTMPAHPVAEGQAFAAPDAKSIRELVGWLAAADALMRQLDGEIPVMGPASLWPHHFDTAKLHVLEGEGESMRSVGIGLSPGDELYDEPYVYVTPWPYPGGDELFALPRGHWHTEGWTGAVLRASSILELSGIRRAIELMKMVRVAHRDCAKWLRQTAGGAA